MQSNLVWMNCQIDVDHEQKARILAAELRISRSEFQRRAIVQYIKQIQEKKGVKNANKH